MFEDYILLWAFGLSGCCAAFFAFHPLSKNRLAVDSVVGPQKIHQGLISRLGGACIFLSLLCLSVINYESNILMLTLLVATAPVFFAGVSEDLTGNVSARVRLFFSLLTGLIFCLMSGYSISRVGIEEIRVIFEFSVISISLTALAVASLANAMNIIDGLNGLASGCFIIIALSIAIVAVSVNDTELAFYAFLMASATAGFFIWNYPFGRIFLGDGGAYLLGGLAAGLAVLLPERNPVVSPFFSLLVVAFPFYELVRSTFRRANKGSGVILKPDDKHLHSLLFKIIQARTPFQPWVQNGLASTILLFFALGTSIWALVYRNEMTFLVAGIFICILVYEVSIIVLRKAASSS